eukprot:TRINITY_DN14321_c0_g2_i1.p2 TRINITY_DN14321_c0_g2~~TRINITY_DN14321_c0_g2_i1.p2  ORF type:complete len:118 (+),score=35.05 TRINITY_DN14321_c0_g2_i1:474-827(+)
MSTQLTGNTCYFQTYLFAVLCKVCCPALGEDKSLVELQHLDRLGQVTVDMSKFLLNFYVQQDEAGLVLRPLTNANFILDFYRYGGSVFFLSLIHISEPTRLLSISYAVFCLKKKKMT